jgi:hypothetical protein
VISSPVGPVLKNGKPMTQETPSTAMSYENAYPVKPASMDTDRNNKENSPPNHPPMTSKSHTSKSSRALPVLSTITHTFSRSSLSLASFKSNRNFSGTSGASSIASTEQKTPKASTSSSSTRRPLIPRFDAQPTTSPAQPESTKAVTTPPQPAEPDKITNERAEPIELDPKLIYTAQPSAYWTGRFTALRDKYHSELLEPETLHIVLEEHMRRSDIEEHLIADPGPNNRTTTDTNPPPRTPTRISNAPSLPSRLILKPTPSTRIPATLGSASFSSRPPLSSGLSRMPFNKSSTTAPRRQSYDLPSSSSRYQAGNMAPPPAPTLASASGITSFAPSDSTAAQRRQTILLTSDDARRRRVFAALHSLCATQAARESLRAWQTAYARRVGKECLLPAGESLVEEDSSRGRKSSWGRGGRGSTTWKREPSLASSNGTEGNKTVGVMSRLRMFSAGRRSQLNVMEMGQGGGGSVVGGGVVSEPGQVPAWVRDGLGHGGQEGGERKMRVKRIKRVEHGF